MNPARSDVIKFPPAVREDTTGSTRASQGYSLRAGPRSDFVSSALPFVVAGDAFLWVVVSLICWGMGCHNLPGVMICLGAGLVAGSALGLFVVHILLELHRMSVHSYEYPQFP
jgi:hypothetical protein